MEERSKTIMCSVLFLDIAEYSKKSVSGQISLKERFNAYLSVAIRDVPLDDRIILDTGDGAALSFLGDVEDALQVALSMRESLRSEAAHKDPPLLVRMGINLGPVRLIKDINGQPNIVGDGINVAQRIMGFADPGQILVSRSYYDAVSRLSHEYGDMFHYQGARTDKHVREHEVYAIGYPGEFTAQQPAAGNITAKWHELSRQLGEVWQNAAHRLGEMAQAGITLYREATPRQRAAYGGGAAGVLVLMLLVALMVHHASNHNIRVAETTEQNKVLPDADNSVKAPAVKNSTEAVEKKTVETTKSVPAANGKAATSVKPSGPSSQTAAKPAAPAKKSAGKPKQTNESRHTNKAERKTQPSIFGIPLPAKPKPGYVSIYCRESSSIFIDGFSKGVAGRTPLTIAVDPGRHRLTISRTGKSSVYSEAIVVRKGETLHLHPAFCQ